MLCATLDDIDYGFKRSKSFAHKSHKHSRKSRKKNKHKSRSKSYSSLTDPCSVCLEDNALLDTQLFPCKHRFHGECLVKWVETGRKFNCPLCRQDIAHFVLFTSDQPLNDKLIEIWNEHYLCDNEQPVTPHKPEQNNLSCFSSPEPIEKHEMTCKSRDIDTTTIVITPDKPKIIIDHSSINTNHCKAPASNNEDTCNNSSFKAKSKSCSDIGTIKCSQILKKQYASYLQARMYLSSILFPIYSANLYQTCGDDGSLLVLPPNNNGSYGTSNSILPSYRYDNKAHSANIISETAETETADKSISEQQGRNSVGRMLEFTKMNAKGGVFAGVCAGATTFLVSTKISSRIGGIGYYGRTLVPILGEATPSIAVFFTGYEHLKKYLFNVNNETQSYMQCFGERFISAGIASSVACSIHLRYNPTFASACLPFRFAAFFGTFELCKDLMNKRSSELNLAQVASAAAVGGTVSHSLYFPLSNLNSALSSVQLNGTSGFVANNNSVVLSRALYRGWATSFSKFLPSCVVCSCAFEYSTRYLKSH